jgi:hypothetical protein
VFEPALRNVSIDQGVSSNHGGVGDEPQAQEKSGRQGSSYRERIRTLA